MEQFLLGHCPFQIIPNHKAGTVRVSKDQKATGFCQTAQQFQLILLLENSKAIGC